MFRILTTVALAVSLTAAPQGAQHPHLSGPAQAAPGTIKALTVEQQDQYRRGAGMGLAKPAELNGYPGPKHVLEQADPLALTEAQRAKVLAIATRMQQEAIRLGAAILEHEAALDALFASRHATPDRAQALAGMIGQLNGQLRAAHLSAHIDTVAVLTPEQVGRYASAYASQSRQRR